MFDWHGIEVRASAAEWEKFTKLRYLEKPLYSEEFLKSWQRKRKRERLKKAEREVCERFLKRVEKEGDGFAAKRFYVEKVSKQVGFGLFARTKIRKGSVIGMYTGKVIQAKKESSSRFLFYFSRMKNWDIDARTMRNYTAFMNHAKARSLACNAKSVEFYCEEPKIIFIATRDIKKGSQICYDYGDDYWDPLDEEPDDFKRISETKPCVIC